MTSTAEQAAEFARAGYLHLDGFFAAKDMDRLDRVIRDYYGDQPAFRHNEEFLQNSHTEVVPWFPQNEGRRDFDLIDEDPRLAELTAAILDDGWMGRYCVVMFSKQGTSGRPDTGIARPTTARPSTSTGWSTPAPSPTASAGRPSSCPARIGAACCRPAIRSERSGTRS